MKGGMMVIAAVLGVMLGPGGVAFGADVSGQAPGGVMGSAGQAMTQELERPSVNIASVEELQRVPGLDWATARNIVDYREANGPFGSINDLGWVEGMDLQKLHSLRGLLTVARPGSGGGAGRTSGGAGSEGGVGSGEAGGAWSSGAGLASGAAPCGAGSTPETPGDASAIRESSGYLGGQPGWEENE